MRLPRAVIVHGVPDARTALTAARAAGQPVCLLSAPWAGVYGGVGWWRGLVAAALADAPPAGTPPPDILDCGDAAGRALEALRGGQRLLVLRGPHAVLDDLGGRAAQLGARLLTGPPSALDLAEHGAARRLAAWLSGDGRVNAPEVKATGRTQEGDLADMSGSKLHIAAVFETIEAARAAQAALVGAGIPTGEVLVLDRGSHSPPVQARGRLWGALRARLLPERDSHHYAEAITRGHPLLVADIDAAQQEVAVTALRAASPLDLEAHVETWTDAGWSGEYEGRDQFEDDGGADAARSEGVTGADLIAGDYGAVGSPIGARVDTNITRGTVRLYRPG